MKLKDVIHYYLGCKVYVPKNGKVGAFIDLHI